MPTLQDYWRLRDRRAAARLAAERIARGSSDLLDECAVAEYPPEAFRFVLFDDTDPWARPESDRRQRDASRSPSRFDRPF